MKASRTAKLLIGTVFTVAWSLAPVRAGTWEDIRAGMEKITAVSAEFTQEKHLKILARPLISQGVLYFRAPRSLRWEYRWPIQSVLLFHEGKTRRFVLQGGRVIEDAGANLPALQVVLDEITRWLKGRFEENPSFIPRLEKGPKIVLRPKETQGVRMIQRIELALTGREGVIKSVRIYETEESFTQIEFNNVRLNPSLPDTLFRKME